MRTGDRDLLPPGYVRLAGRDIEAVGLAALAAPLTMALQAGSFYRYAAMHPEARAMVGRGLVYAAPLPDGVTRAVVRRSQHGGLLAPITGERFLGRTRAPRELATALRLADLGVPTPAVLAYAVYPAGAFTRRADVVTREVDGAVDLAAALATADSAPVRQDVLHAVARLLGALAASGACHPDLNLKNILIRRDACGGTDALVIDVDRVWFGRPGAKTVAARNARRLARSLERWRVRHALPIEPAELAWLATGGPAPASPHA